MTGVLDKNKANRLLRRNRNPHKRLRKLVKKPNPDGNRRQRRAYAALQKQDKHP